MPREPKLAHKVLRKMPISKKPNALRNKALGISLSIAVGASALFGINKARNKPTPEFSKIVATQMVKANQIYGKNASWTNHSHFVEKMANDLKISPKRVLLTLEFHLQKNGSDLHERINALNVKKRHLKNDLRKASPKYKPKIIKEIEDLERINYILTQVGRMSQEQLQEFHSVINGTRGSLDKVKRKMKDY